MRVLFAVLTHDDAHHRTMRIVSSWVNENVGPHRMMCGSTMSCASYWCLQHCDQFNTSDPTIFHKRPQFTLESSVPPQPNISPSHRQPNCQTQRVFETPYLNVPPLFVFLFALQGLIRQTYLNVPPLFVFALQGLPTSTSRHFSSSPSRGSLPQRPATFRLRPPGAYPGNPRQTLKSHLGCLKSR